MPFRKLNPHLKTLAIIKRNQGKLLNEIAKELSVANSTVSLWLRGYQLDRTTSEILKYRRGLSYQRNKELRKDTKAKNESKRILHIQNLMRRLKPNKLVDKLLCAFLYWAEGGKTDSSLSFINSDPKMISVFLILLRRNWPIEEEKFRITLHVHSHHNKAELIKLWSENTNIPPNQFTKVYVKPNGGKIIKPTYKGTARIRYYDYRIVQELKDIYNAYTDLYVRGSGDVV